MKAYSQWIVPSLFFGLSSLTWAGNALAHELTEPLSPPEQDVLDLALSLATNDENMSSVKAITQHELNEINAKSLDYQLSSRDLLHIRETLRSSRPAGLSSFALEDAIKAFSEVIDVRLTMDDYETHGHQHFGKLKCWMVFHPNPTECLPSDSPQRSPFKHKFSAQDRAVFEAKPDDRSVIGFCDARTNDPNAFKASRRGCIIREVSEIRLLID